MTRKDVHLLLGALDADADVMSGRAVNNAVGVTEQVKAILEECWLERHKVLKLFQVNRSLEQLPVWIIGEVGEDEL